jgi:hypothetical protein
MGTLSRLVNEVSARRVPFAALLAALVSCKSSSDATPAVVDASLPPDPCAVLFGNPNDKTGLGPDRCQPRCTCGDAGYEPPVYSASFIQSLVTDWSFAATNPEIPSDPYADAAAPPVDPDGTVCAVIPQGDPATRPRPYLLATFASESDARAAGGSPTHFGRCGVCSTLANLAVYMRENDLTAPVRDCGVNAGKDAGADVDCLMQLGFDRPCAEIWAYDTAHTRDACIGVCFANASKPYNQDDGTLNPCIECDEVESGPVFKFVAGRTRRSSGLPNAICRPCSEVRPLVHSY